jgi:hypothetical protein
VIMQAVTLTALLLLAYATGVAHYALIAAWILRPRPQRAIQPGYERLGGYPSRAEAPKQLPKVASGPAAGA